MRRFVNPIQVILVIAIVLLGQSSTLAQKPDSLLYKQLPDYPFVFVSDSIVTSPPVITDSLFDVIARGIRFRVNRTELEVYVKGAASPEGPYLNNVRLSRERTKRLIEFLSGNLDQPIADRPLNAKCVTEDYAYLVKLMELAGDAEYKQVKYIWESCHGDERLCKKKLMAYNKGKTWKRLLQVYFPTLRQSRVVLWCTQTSYCGKDKPAARFCLCAAIWFCTQRKYPTGILSAYGSLYL